MLNPLLVGADRVKLLAEAALDEALEALGDRLAGLKVHILLGLDEPLGRKAGSAPSVADQLALAMHDRTMKRGASAVVVEAIARRGCPGSGSWPQSEALAAHGADVVLFGGAHSDFDPEIIQRLSSLRRLFGAGDIRTASFLVGLAAFVLLADPGFARRHALPVRARLHSVGTGSRRRPERICRRPRPRG